MEEAVLLGEPTFVPIGGGRFRCVETGHELLERDKPTYAASKKCRAALFDRALAEGKPPLNYFKQSPDSRDKIICKLNGAIVNKTEKAVWKHVLGKSFTNKLSSEEKKPEGEARTPSDKKPSKKEKEKKLENSDDDDDDDDDLKFWMPPETDSEPDEPIIHEKKKKNKKKKNSDDDEKVEIGKQHGKSEEKIRKQKKKKDPAIKPVSKSNGSATKPGSDNVLDGDTEQRMKRLALAVGPSNCASRKKKRKTQT